ncbi:MAG: PIN domain-containing protein [Pseudonocardiales bacterium]|nr:PIN domain-containing protein [Pseudonocardiales bacterium]
MIAIDANLLVYAHVTSYAQHETARAWLEEQLVAAPRVGLPWASLLAFVRLVTNPRLFTEPESITDAWGQVAAWLDADPVWTPAPTARHRQALGTCLAGSGLRANDVPDAHLAALALEHGLRLATSDSGFARFSGLEWFNPLQPA